MTYDMCHMTRNTWHMTHDTFWLGHMVTDYDTRHVIFQFSRMVYEISQKYHLPNKPSIFDECARKARHWSI